MGAGYNLVNIDKIRKKFLAPQQTDEMVAQLLEAILTACEPETVILFGSASRYQLTRSSDLDVVVIFSKEINLKLARKSLFEKSGQLPFPVDFIVIDKDTFDKKSAIGGALFDARTEGRVIYSKQTQF